MCVPRRLHGGWSGCRHVGSLVINLPSWTIKDESRREEAGCLKEQTGIIIILVNKLTPGLTLVLFKRYLESTFLFKDCQHTKTQGSQLIKTNGSQIARRQQDFLSLEGMKGFRLSITMLQTFCNSVVYKEGE